jgi:hypothetical protein
VWICQTLKNTSLPGGIDGGIGLVFFAAFLGRVAICSLERAVCILRQFVEEMSVFMSRKFATMAMV